MEQSMRAPQLTKAGFALVTFSLVVVSAWPAVAATSLSNGYQILRERGLQVQALVFSYPDNGKFDLNRWSQSNFTTMTYGLGTPVAGYFPLPGIPWSQEVDSSQLSSSELPLVQNLVSLQYEDEVSIADPQFLSSVSTWMTQVRAKYPNVILYTNEYGGQNTAAQLRAYVQTVHPDMLNFDYYPWGSTAPAGGSPTELYAYMAKFRQVALAGYDGTGTQPIPYGMYTQTYMNGTGVPSESQMALSQFAALTFGYTTTTAFVYNDYDTSSVTVDSTLFDGTGYAHPTAQFFELANINLESRQLGPSLVRLQSVDVRIIPGQHHTSFGSTVNNSVPSGTSTWAPGSVSGDYINAIAATNMGTLNNGLRGDVWISYSHPMLSSDPGGLSELYFMVLNGLTDPNGTSVQTDQSIRIDFDFLGSGINSLERLSRSTGVVEIVPLIYDGGSRYHLILQLGGGTADLFKFNDGVPFLVPEPAHVVLMLSGGFVLLCWGGLRRLASKPMSQMRLPESFGRPLHNQRE
jgi:hypothetical protein